MKNKTIILLMILLVFTLILLSACGSSESSEDNKTTEIEATEDTNAEQVEKTEKSVKAIAEALGLKNQGEVYFEMIGAKDGAEFNGGAVELYVFDESSDEYKAIINGEGAVTASAYKDGVILVFPSGTNPDKTIIKAFNKLVF